MSVVTPWFKASVKPVRIGIYETIFSGQRGFSYWDGALWTNQTPTYAEVEKDWFSGSYQSKKWRGLAKEPK